MGDRLVNRQAEGQAQHAGQRTQHTHEAQQPRKAWRPHLQRKGAFGQQQRQPGRQAGHARRQRPAPVGHGGPEPAFTVARDEHARRPDGQRQQRVQTVGPAAQPPRARHRVRHRARGHRKTHRHRPELQPGLALPVIALLQQQLPTDGHGSHQSEVGRARCAVGRQGEGGRKAPAAALGHRHVAPAAQHQRLTVSAGQDQIGGTQGWMGQLQHPGPAGGVDGQVQRHPHGLARRHVEFGRSAPGRLGLDGLQRGLGRSQSVGAGWRRPASHAEQLRVRRYRDPGRLGQGCARQAHGQHQPANESTQAHGRAR